MMRAIVLPLLCAASALAAQNPAATGEGQQHRVERLRVALGLTAEQAAKLQATQERFVPQRRDVMRRQGAILSALRGQLQPGVAANGDSVRKLLDASDQSRGALLQLQRDEEKEIAGYLSPVQRARYQLMRARWHQRFVGMQERSRGMRGWRRWRRPG